MIPRKLISFWFTYPSERNKVIAMLIMAFLITFVYEILRPIKTALILTADGSSAKIIPYLRMWLVLPSSFLMTWFISKLSSRFKRNQIFYIVLSLFLVLLFFFTTVLYPYQKILELECFTEFLSSKSILTMKEPLLIIKYWPRSLFFVLAELWVTAILSILFWGYVNEVTSLSDAKKLYAILLFVGNSAVIFSGLLGQLFSSSFFHSFIPSRALPWDKTVYGTLTFVLILGLCIIFIFSYLDSIVIQKRQISESKIKFEITKVFKSSQLIFLTFIVIAYNISYNLIEVLWTSKLHECYYDPTQLNSYINRVTFLTGIFSALLALLVCRPAIQKFGWTITALITPIIWLITGLGFLISILSQNFFLYQMLAAFLDFTPLAFTVFIGATQISLGRASKYTLFDQTKEMVFIPLGPSEQRTGKAWIEGIITWVGKLGAALIYQLFLLLFLEANLVSYILYTFLGLLSIWIISIHKLSKKMPI